jgi:hypothetical protein
MTTFRAHDSPVMALDWQPLPDHSSHSAPDRHTSSDGQQQIVQQHQQQRRLFAVASLDGTVRLFNGYSPWQCVHTLPFGLNRYPVVAMAFSPSGAFLAAASPGKVLIWDIDGDGTVRASWHEGAATSSSPSSYSSSFAPSSGQQQPPSDALVSSSRHSGNPLAELIRRPYRLGWNADGTRLSYASRSQVCVFPSHIFLLYFFFFLIFPFMLASRPFSLLMNPPSCPCIFSRVEGKKGKRKNLEIPFYFIFFWLTQRFDLD